jgi:hypothetical protein
LWRHARTGAGRLWAPRRRLAVTGTAFGAIALPVLCLTGLLPAASAGLGRARGEVAPLPKPAQLPEHARAASRRERPPRVGQSKRSSCRSVVYIGDSTSEGSVSADYIPNPRLRLDGQLAEVGVTSTHPEISGARSVVETFEGQPNAATVARGWVSRGYRGCWILALGTNEVDNVYDQSPIGFKARVARMMSIIRRQPVMWVDSISLLRSGGYAEDSMQRWNRALLASCRRYPTMRVFDWAAHARERWFINDGLHYTSPGYVARTRLIAKALAAAFPVSRTRATSCVVR